jgi:ubiquinone/menaquinone biosynthesis C-methylase UbiE
MPSDEVSTPANEPGPTAGIPASILEAIDVERIHAVPLIRRSVYKELDVVGTLDFFARRYVAPLSRVLDFGTSTAVDCGAGYGWFSIAYVLAGGRSAIEVDLHAERLDSAREIAEIIGVADRIQFMVSPIQEIPLGEDSAELVVSIETLEHIGRASIPGALAGMKRIASRAILLATPNKLFPIVSHDTSLPFAHWLPRGLRRIYARALGRQKKNHDNAFLSPFDLRVWADKFRPASSCLTFQGYREYRDHFPFYLPYGSRASRRRRVRPNPIQAVYYRLASALLGTRSYWVFPSLSRIFVRR